ncbi:MAG: family 20 glycosylhydrolase [Bacteroidota bacterium]|nr:family 20 glycosylhydrolase [Bacteroidota bacterium]
MKIIPMKVTSSFLLFFSIFIFFSDFSFSKVLSQDNKPSFIPMPDKIEWIKGEFLLSNNIYVSSSNADLEKYLISQTKSLTGIELKHATKTFSGKKIVLKTGKLKNGTNKEAYSLSVSEKQIEITGNTEEGVFRGIQTFFQLIPPLAKSENASASVAIPLCKISDSPAFSWRGLMLDCSRHFMTKDFIKRYIDILAYYKFNTLHWHLTDDQGFRIEIKKYPKLTQVGGFRKEADGTTYGGYYSQEDIKEIVSYAKSRFINIVPEIDMPGHSLAALASYPENSCTGGPFEVTNIWGVMKDIYCPGRDSTFTFVEGILDEIVNLFPGKYIHIGGDEAPKDRWKECPKCQARIKSEGLKDEHELQSYFVKRIASYLASKGKKVIGWDEVLQGGLAPGIFVQSWQSFQGAIDAAKQKHYVICSPASHTYLNGDPSDLDLRIAYSFQPIPRDLTKEEGKFVLGGEACLWTEQAPQETVDSKLFPRILALSEVFWKNPQNKDYDGFYSRLQKSYEDLSALGIKYGRESKIFTSSTAYDESKKEFSVSIQQGQKDIDIRYTLDGTEPKETSPRYESPIIINKTSSLKIAAFKKDHQLSKSNTLAFNFHKALNSHITLKTPYDERYRASGENGLIDGVRASVNAHDGLWQGFEGIDFEATIDLGKIEDISKVAPRFLLDENSWIFLPSKVEISVSTDNINFTDAKTIINDIPLKNSEILLKDFQADYNNVSARYIKVKATTIKKCPSWHPGFGSNAWMFIDEIVVE